LATRIAASETLMIQYAFKEWAVICRALAEGRQALILRKGGVAEEGGVFQPEHSRFWLYPTYVHQQSDGVKPEAQPLWQAVSVERPPEGALRLTHFAEVSGTFFLNRLDQALALDPLHLWSLDTVMKRFAYREPGLYALAVRVYRLPQAFETAIHPEYEGCKTWVELKEEVPSKGATPVLDDRQYADFLERLDGLLNPRAYA
jgi:hypothetical protein